MIDRDVQIFRRGHIFWRDWSDDDKEYPGIISKKRPVLIISNNIGLAQSDVATVIPITSSDRRHRMPTHVEIWIKGVRNYILCEQIYTCHISTLGNYVGVLSEDKMSRVEEALLVALGVNSNPPSSELCLSDTTYADEQIENEDKDELIPSQPSPNSDSQLTKRERLVWTPERKLQLCVEVESVSSGEMQADDLVRKYGYSSYASLCSIARRFRKQLGV